MSQQFPKDKGQKSEGPMSKRKHESQQRSRQEIDDDSLDRLNSDYDRGALN